MVLDVAMAQGDCAIEEGRLGAVQFAWRVTANRNRAVRPVPLVVEVLVALQPAEVVEDVDEAPAGVAQGRPGVVVMGRASQCKACVGGRAPAHDPASRQLHPPAKRRVGRIAPVVIDCRLGRVEDVARQRAHIGVIGPSLDEQHRSIIVLAQPVGEDAARRATTDNNDVVSHRSTITRQSGKAAGVRLVPFRRHRLAQLRFVSQPTLQCAAEILPADQVLDLGCGCTCRRTPARRCPTSQTYS